MCRSVLLSGCLAAGFSAALPLSAAIAQQASPTPYTEYVVQAPVSIRATAPQTAGELRSDLMDLIQAQAPTIETLRQQDQDLRDRQQPALDRLNGEVRALLDSQRDTRDALTAQLRALRDEQTAYLNLHPDASDHDLTVLRNQMQALKDRQKPIREKMKSDLMALIDHQKPERDALRAERLALRESQVPVRNQLLSAREDLERRIAALGDQDDATDAIADAGNSLAPLSSGIAGLEQLTAPAPALTPRFEKQPIGQMPVRLDLPEQPDGVDAR
jgi:gas vesicle protein